MRLAEQGLETDERTGFVDGKGTHFKLTIHGPWEHTKNDQKQVGIQKLRVYGYDSETPTSKTKADSAIKDEKATAELEKYPLEFVRTRIVVVERRLKRAEEEGNIFEKKMCASALECLTKAEEEIRAHELEGRSGDEKMRRAHQRASVDCARQCLKALTDILPQ